MAIQTIQEIIEDLVKYSIAEECKQPYLQDESVCCQTEYSGCCCHCSRQLPIYNDFPVSYIYCYICLSPLKNKCYLNTTHGYCSNFTKRETIQ